MITYFIWELFLWFLFINTNPFESYYYSTCIEDNSHNLNDSSLQEPNSEILLSYESKEDIKNHIIKNKINKEFIDWVVGFIDAEGCFSIFNDDGSFRFKLAMNLHSDDVNVLWEIRDTFNIGNVNCYEEKKFATWAVYDEKELLYIISFFDNHHLQSKKYVDYKVFKKFLMRRIYLKNNSLNLTSSKISTILWKEFEKYSPFYNSTNYILEENELANDRIVNINSNWIVGFVEGEGTFGIKTVNPYFQVGQNKISENVLMGIDEFFNNYLKDRNITFGFHQTGEVKVKMSADTDSLWNIILPFFEEHTMRTKKIEDFILWKKALYTKKSGLYFTPDGRKLIVLISKVINYTKKPISEEDRIKVLKLIDKLSSKVLNMTPLIDVNSTTSFTSAVRSCKKPKNKKIYVYSVEINKDNLYVYELQKGSPFKTYGEANKAMNLSSSAKGAFNHLDTDKLYNNEYLVVSKELKSTLLTPAEIESIKKPIKKRNKKSKN